MAMGYAVVCIGRSASEPRVVFRDKANGRRVCAIMNDVSTATAWEVKRVRIRGIDMIAGRAGISGRIVP